MATRKTKAVVEETPNIEEINEVKNAPLVSLFSINEREGFTMPKYEKINRDEWQEFLNITPNAQEPSWKIIGVGITDKATDYNSEKTEEKWIIHRNKNVTVDSYGLTSGVEQTCYKGDEVFEFIDNIRYRLGTGSAAETTLLEIDKYSASGTEEAPTYRARLWNVAIEIGSFGGDTAKINYTINYTGDPTFGTVTFSNGNPMFTAEDE